MSLELNPHSPSEVFYQSQSGRVGLFNVLTGKFLASTTLRPLQTASLRTAGQFSNVETEDDVVR